MSEVLIREFESDLDRIQSLLDFIDQVKVFMSVQLNTETDAFASATLDSDYGDFFSSAVDTHRRATDSRLNLAILPGTLLLYLSGRFEDYVKSSFEELAEEVATNYGGWDVLPRDMKDSLVKYTAEVIANPRKYGHAENGVVSFVTVLHANLNNDLSRINTQCLSVTHENMRSDILKELFERIGAKSIWDKIGEKMSIKNFFETHENARATSQSKKLLNEIMDTRNRIAHPSANIDWPALNKIREYTGFLKALGAALNDCVQEYSYQLRPTQSTTAISTSS
ncbi:hypothetical protein JZ785_27075 [Alicyclobacillus curvatus]|nr:hypothetical protein JZ785_27075 [Alicyclobacillus curvatus]